MSKKKESSVNKAKVTISDDDYIDLTNSLKRTFDVISTGSLVLNKVIGIGGIPRGRITEIFGGESSGKTTLATSIAIQAQKQGGSVLYLDFENAFDPNYAQAIGLDLDPNKFALFQPSYFEKAAQYISQALAKYKIIKSTGEKREIPEKDRGLWVGDGVGVGVPDLIILDSIAAIMMKKEYEGDHEASKEIGLLPRALSSYLRNLVTKIRETNTAVVLINQERANIKLTPYAGGPDYETTGGKAIKYYASLRMRLQIKKKEKARVYNEAIGDYDEVPIQNVIKAQTVKNKVGNPYRVGEFVIRYGEGVDNLRSVLDIAIGTKVIKKSGAWFTYNSQIKEENNFKLQGLESVRDHIMENPELVLEIQDQVEEHIVKDSGRGATASDIEKEHGDNLEIISEEYDD